jgi:type VI secretion system protein ImpB
MAESNSQKFIGRNNAPRVQIEYDVEIYGAQKKVQLPFVTGVMADLSGHRAQPLPSVEQRKFVDISVDNFDAQMRSIKPNARFHVEDTLTGDGSLLDIDLCFESMDDFTPGAIARNVPEMAALLDARERLSQLITYMDGKSSAEDIIRQLLEKPDWLMELTGGETALSAVAPAVDDTNDNG